MLASGSRDENGSFVGCVHRSAKGRPRKPRHRKPIPLLYGRLFAGFFAGWADVWPVALALDDNRGSRMWDVSTGQQRAVLERHSRRRVLVAGFFAGWSDPGQRQLGTERFACGMCLPVSKRPASKDMMESTYRCPFRRMGRPWPLVAISDGTILFVGCVHRSARRPSSKDIRGGTVRIGVISRRMVRRWPVADGGETIRLWDVSYRSAKGRPRRT